MLFVKMMEVGIIGTSVLALLGFQDVRVACCNGCSVVICVSCVC